MTNDLSPQLGGQSDVTGREPELSGARETPVYKLMQALQNPVEGMQMLRHVGMNFGYRPMTRWEKFRLRFWLFFRNEFRAQRIIINRLASEPGLAKENE